MYVHDEPSGRSLQRMPPPLADAARTRTPVASLQQTNQIHPAGAVIGTVAFQLVWDQKRIVQKWRSLCCQCALLYLLGRCVLALRYVAARQRVTLRTTCGNR